MISVLQKEMSKEQGHFDSLNAERSSLKKNSGQYKSVSKDMSTSQTRLTLLMNRSMKCFSLVHIVIHNPAGNYSVVVSNFNKNKMNLPENQCLEVVAIRNFLCGRLPDSCLIQRPGLHLT